MFFPAKTKRPALQFVIIHCPPPPPAPQSPTIPQAPSGKHACEFPPALIGLQWCGSTESRGSNCAVPFQRGSESCRNAAKSTPTNRATTEPAAVFKHNGGQGLVESVPPEARTTLVIFNIDMGYDS